MTLNQNNIRLAVNLYNILVNKEKEITIDKIIRIADALNVSFEELTKEVK